MPSRRILFVFTSAGQLGDRPTGWFLPEAAHPYYVLVPHHAIEFASPAGPNPPVDPLSLEMFKDDTESIKFLEDAVVKEKLANMKKLSEVKASDYDAIFYVGGHGPLLDLANDPVNIQLATEFYRNGKPIAAVCHGQASLIGVKDAQGKSIFDGKIVTGFSNEEEDQVGLTTKVPFLIESKLQSLGAKYTAAKPWGPKVSVDGNLITGQNPASAKGVGEAILTALA